MSEFKLSTKLVQDQMAAASIKGMKLAEGTVITLTGEAKASEFKDRKGESRTFHSFNAVTSEGKIISLPVGELTRMVRKDGTVLVNVTGEETTFVPKFSIAGSKDRTNANGVVYPVSAYKNADEYRNEESEHYNDYAYLIKDGIKADNTLAAIQDYTVIVD